jgi:hypothetical protein
MQPSANEQESLRREIREHPVAASVETPADYQLLTAPWSPQSAWNRHTALTSRSAAGMRTRGVRLYALPVLELAVAALPLGRPTRPWAGRQPCAFASAEWTPPGGKEVALVMVAFIASTNCLVIVCVWHLRKCVFIFLMFHVPRLNHTMFHFGGKYVHQDTTSNRTFCDITIGTCLCKLGGCIYDATIEFAVELKIAKNKFLLRTARAHAHTVDGFFTRPVLLVLALTTTFSVYIRFLFSSSLFNET